MRKRITLLPHRQPAQARSRDTVQRILEAALQVLKSNGVEGFTNNHVAQQAQLSIASVYQFFPNKQAIIYRLYQDWLTAVTSRLVHTAEERQEERDWRCFAEQLSDGLAASTLDPQAEFELLRAMWSHRELIELDRKHAHALGTQVAQEMRRFGSRRPLEELTAIATFANELHSLVAERSTDAQHGDKPRLDGLARIAYLALWEYALSTPAKRPRRSSPAVRRKHGASSARGALRRDP